MNWNNPKEVEEYERDKSVYNWLAYMLDKENKTIKRLRGSKKQRHERAARGLFDAMIEIIEKWV